MKKPKNDVPPESYEQIRFVTWLKKQGYRVSGSANGGKRHILEAIKLRNMGVSPGYPDVEVPLPSGHYHGFYCELKRISGGKVSQEQKEWFNYLNEKGYYACIAYGFDEAKKAFEFYMSFTKQAA